MAGEAIKLDDWIPCEIALFKKREVLAIARQTRRSRHEVGGLLLDFWGWFSSQSEDGEMAGIGVDSLPSIIGADVKFWRVVVGAGWIKDNGDAGISIPNAERWVSNGAKARLQKNRRQARWRDGNVGGDVDAGASTGTPTTPSQKASTRDRVRVREDKEKTLTAADLVITAPSQPTAPAAANPEPDRIAEAVALCQSHDYLRDILDLAATVKACARAHPELDPYAVVCRAIAWLTPEQIAEQRRKGKGAAKCLVSFWDVAARQGHEQRDGPPGTSRQVGLSQSELLAEYERRQRGTA